MPDIRLEHLIKIYGSHPRQALTLFRNGADRDTILKETGQVLGVADVSLEIHSGETFVVMGLSGSGKSTLVRCINRLIQPTSGHIYIDGDDIVHFNADQLRQLRLNQVSMVFQHFGLFPHKTVVENVEYGLHIKGMPKRQRRQKALETLDIVGLSEWANYLPSSLSGGMQQRVGLARALATDAGILLMDEPFSALDPLIRRSMQDELIRLQHDLNKTIVFISHDIQEAMRIGDRIAIMKDGHIVQIGTPEDLITQPTNEYVRSFIKDVNRAQVLKTGTLARPVPVCQLGQHSAKTLWKPMQQQQHMYVVDQYHKPIGLLEHRHLESALQQGITEIVQIMHTNFATVSDHTSIDAIFHQFQTGFPLAVINDDGEFQGTIDASDVLASLADHQVNVRVQNRTEGVTVDSLRTTAEDFN